MAAKALYTKTLADWAVRSDFSFSDQSLDRARTAILDSAGCMLGGLNDPAALAMAGAVASWAPSDASGPSESPAVWNALVGGVAAHALDFDDNFFPPISHASAVLTPALLALAAETGSRQQEVLEAYIIGLEVQARMGQAANPGHYESGWHATSTLGTVGAAVACARLCRLDAVGMLHALSLAFSFCGGSKLQFGTMAKPAHAGFAAMHAVMAATMARAGISANPEPFAAKWGFLDLFHGSDKTPAVPSLFPERPLAIDEFGLVAKLYPSCMSSHLGIDGLLDMRAQGMFRDGLPVAVEIHMPSYMIANLRFSDPQNEMEARFSMHYCAAVAMIDGVPRLAHFTPEGIAREDLRALLSRVSMHPRIASRQAAALPWGGDALVVARFADGESVAREVLYPKGCNQNPLTPEESRGKFLDCAMRLVPGEMAELLFRAFQTFGGPEPCARLTNMIRDAWRAGDRCNTRHTR
jgi:2-methylcitrate dehydratase PrpD